jgi:hypothetical protein
MRESAVPNGSGQAFQAEAVTGHDDVLHAVAAPASPVPLGEQQRHPLGHMMIELGEAAGRSLRSESTDASPAGTG